MSDYDVIIVGAGHAGCEAALACARLHRKTLLMTLRFDRIAWMSCNPSIGGIGKSHIVKEVDALGGQMAQNTDSAAIQIRRLNMSKGPAVQATRVQCDLELYAKNMRNVLENQPNLDLIEDKAIEIISKNGSVCALITEKNAEFSSKAIVLTTGTFLKGLLHTGNEQIKGGRRGEDGADGLSESLIKLGLRLGRLKTGTPPRLDGDTIDFEAMIEQSGDSELRPFSFFSQNINLPQLPCYITFTNPETHRIIHENVHRAPLFTGQIKSRGPRYCPSIEDKVVRFSDRTRHQLFIEPVGLNTKEYYPNGISTSLPKDVQEKIVNSIKGLEQAKILKYAYAVEYDFVFPDQLDPTLMVKSIQGLYLAGQINGTTGYEEAAGQGIMAGINAARKVSGDEPFTLNRSQAYIGVMIDDLITKGITEPYRMFTSRAEYRLALREDNADERLLEKGFMLGLVSKKNYHNFCHKYDKIKEIISRLSNTRVNPDEETNMALQNAEIDPITGPATLSVLMKRKNVTAEKISNLPEGEFLKEFDQFLKEKVEIHIKYEGYIIRQAEQIERFKKLENLKIPKDLDYNKIPSLSKEMIEKLSRIKPTSLGQASRIPEITPSALNAIIVYLRKQMIL